MNVAQVKVRRISLVFFSILIVVNDSRYYYLNQNDDNNNRRVPLDFYIRLTLLKEKHKIRRIHNFVVSVL